MKIICGSLEKWPKMGVLQGLNGVGSLSFLWASSMVYATLRNPILPQ
jgi:hypothetical protein